MNKSHFVYGPQGCGKTQNARALAQFFGLTHIIDPAENVTQYRPYDHLYLTNAKPGWADADHTNRRVIAFAEAMKMAGLETRS